MTTFKIIPDTTQSSQIKVTTTTESSKIAVLNFGGPKEHKVSRDLLDLLEPLVLLDHRAFKVLKGIQVQLVLQEQLEQREIQVLLVLKVFRD
jgi:hypothetical protein